MGFSLFIISTVLAITVHYFISLIHLNAIYLFMLFFLNKIEFKNKGPEDDLGLVSYPMGF